ncbi:MAG: LysR family transcriptional regulator [Coriobacteriia bacterium]|nr:LysR family transcriptional regulator [Coriobacteriia bacterium]
MLNVNRLRVLREIASRGTIAAAAEALYMTPSAISQQMATLEREAGTPLLERAGRGVRLTPAGERLVTHAERVIAVLEEAQADVDAVARGVAGRLRTCAFPTGARALLIPALSRIRAEYPRLQLSMVDLEPEESVPLLKTGEIDVLLTYEFDHLPQRDDPGVEQVLLAIEPMAIALPVTHPAATGPVRVRDLKDEEWIVGQDGSSLLEVQVRVANEAGFQPKLDLHSNDYQVILAAVEAGLGVALVPPMARFAEYPGVAFRRPEDMEVRRRILAVIRRGSGKSPGIAALVEALRDIARQQAAAHAHEGMVAPGPEGALR